MKHGESVVERQISIQGIHLSAFTHYFWKREGSFKSELFICVTRHYLKNIKLACPDNYQNKMECNCTSHIIY